jgi:hypothetical protein
VIVGEVPGLAGVGAEIEGLLGPLAGGVQEAGKSTPVRAAQPGALSFPFQAEILFVSAKLEGLALLVRFQFPP